MRVRAAIAGFALLLAGCSAGGSAGEPIFRSITIRPFPPITLGERFQPSALSTRQGDSTFALRPRSFGGAETIHVHVLPDGRVYALSFTYGQEESYERKVRSYTGSLGSPAAHTTVDADSIWTVWQDPATRFELARIRARPVRLRARMSDRLLSAR